MEDDPDIQCDPPANFKPLIAKYEPGWNGYKEMWRLPDYAYSRERFQEQWKKYQECKQFLLDNDFEEQVYQFWSDYPELLEKAQKARAEKLKKREMKKKGIEIEEEEQKSELIRLTRPLDMEDLEYVMDNYEYDPEDTAFNTMDDVQAENFIRSKVVEFRKSIGKQI